jgi:SAM-dependent methyltransferase
MGFYSDRVFPVICGGLTRRFEPDRAELLGTATGRVLEIGPGAGTGFVNYTQKAREVVGLEYSAGMLDKAHAELQRLAEAGELRTAVALTQGSVTDLELARPRAGPRARPLAAEAQSHLEQAGLRLQSRPRHPGALRERRVPVRPDRRVRSPEFDATHATQDPGRGHQVAFYSPSSRR